jgi:hypothetical protein
MGYASPNGGRVDDHGLAPLGHALAGVRFAVLDEQGRDVPPGCRGELYVGGALVGRGYAAQPARTAEAFLPDPLGPPGERWYRTGDLVRRLPGGAFAFCGRRDRQVKVRGYRVEPAAVEAVLERQPAVARAAVVARGTLVAYVVPAAGQAVAPDELRAAVARSLPAYAVPSAVVEVVGLPLTAHGKLDVAALPEPGAATPAAAAEPPATPVEAALAEAWRAGLGLSGTVGVTDDFFALGGDSIRAIQVVAEARRLGLALTVEDLFAHRTIRSIAARLDPPGDAGIAPEPDDPPVADLDERDLARLLESMGLR